MASDFDRLNKASQNTQATNNTESEHYSRNRTIRSEEIKSGLARFEGSWASEFSYGSGNKLENTPVPTIKTGLGLQGYGDIDFIPYIENTNRRGVQKGGSTLGSPISFEVLGPTLKSSSVDWTWRINKYSDGEYLEIQNLSSGTMKEAYGFTDDGEGTLPYTEVIDEGGLYVVFRHIGHEISTVNSSDPQRTPYHIFKVERIQSNSLKISSDTPISEVYDYSSDNTIKGVMFIRKVASRMFCVPSSENKAFFVMPPEKSLSLDIEPPLNKWLDGSFDGNNKSGTIETYGNRSNLPVLSPLQYKGKEILKGVVLDQFTSPTDDVSSFVLQVESSYDSDNANVLEGMTVGETDSLLYGLFSVGKIIRIVSLEDDTNNDFLGFFEITDIKDDGSSQPPLRLTLKGVTTQSHTTGFVNWDIPVGVNSTDVLFTVHDSISDLFSKSNPQPHEIESTRIKSLISPLLSESSSNVRPTMMRANECSWDGRETSNLLDLGFKAVVYPARIKSIAGEEVLVADFENPIDSNLYEIDYEGATLYFHEEYTQADSILNHPKNPTGNPVLFISCVALSQDASFGNRFTAIEEGAVKGAFGLPNIKNILSGDAATFGEAVDGNLPSFPNVLYVPGISISEIPSTGAIEFWKNIGPFSADLVDYVLVKYKLVETHLEGVLLHVYETSDLGMMGLANFSDIISNGHVKFVRNPSLSFRESIYAGLSLRSEEITISQGVISLDSRGNQLIKVGGLETDESSIIYNSTENDWEIGGDYQVNLSVKRGDLVASNVIEFGNSELTVTPYSASVKIDVFQIDQQILFVGSEDQKSQHEDLRGYFLNTEAVTIQTKDNPTITAGNRVVFGLDYVADCHNPFATHWYLRESIGSSDTKTVEGEIKLSLPASVEYQNAVIKNKDETAVSITGRNACVYPAYAVLETDTLYQIEQSIISEFGGPQGVLPSSRYLLSLESTESGLEDRWVSLVVNNEEISFHPQHYSDSTDYLQSVVAKLNKDIYFGQTARLLDRAGFYDARGQDFGLDSTYTPNVSLSDQIEEYTFWSSRGERQLLWVNALDPRHPKHLAYTANPNDLSTHTLALICTGRGTNGNVSNISPDALPSEVYEMKDKSILQENRLINVIISIGEIDNSFMKHLFSLQDESHRYFNRIGYYHTGSELADNTTEVDNPTVLGQKGNLDLGFPREGLLPLGRFLGESFRIEQQNFSDYDKPFVFYSSFVDDPTGRSPYYPIRSHFELDILNAYTIESSDFPIQNSWLDNRSFDFEGATKSTPDLRNYTQTLSKDRIGALQYGVTKASDEGGYVEIHTSVSATPKDRSYFYDTYLGLNLGGEDYIAKVDSSKFISPLYDQKVIQKGDVFYFRNSANQQAKATVISVISQHTSNKNTPISLRVLVQPTGGQYGGYSGVSSYAPTISEIDDTSFRPTYEELDITYASLVVGNNILWNEGNIKSLLTTQAISEMNAYGIRDTSAIDSGSGTFGSQSATLISGGRVGLFTGLPLSHAGISFASITGGSTWGQQLELDPSYQDYEKDSYRVFETFIDHGVFPFVSLPSGSSSDNVGTIGSLSSDPTKKSNYKGAVFGGSSGLRVSGDIQLYVKNIRVLGTDKYTAFVVHSDNAPATTTDYLLGNDLVSVDRANYWQDWEPSTTGAIGYFPQVSKDGMSRGAGAHMPSGVGLFGHNNTFNGATSTTASVRRTATISLGLTISDLKGISSSLGQNLVDQELDEGKLNPFIGESNTRTLSKTGETLFEMGQTSNSDIVSMALPALKGCYLYLESPNQNKTDGYFKIIDVPVIAPLDASSEESKFGSENTLHGYISNYNSKVRNSLSSIVANITVRVESNRYFSEIPDNGTSNNRLTRPDQLSPPQNALRDELDAYKWRILHKQSNFGMLLQNVYIFDVENSGGSPSSASSDLQGVEINPRALGKRSLPAEIVPLATYEAPSDTPENLKFNDEHLRGSYSSLRLLGVHRNMDMRGKASSLAFVTIDSDSMSNNYSVDVGGSDVRTSYPMSDLVKSIGNTPARLVVYSSERSDRLDESYALTTKKRFENGESGFVSLGYPERMGLGVVLDGGLGVVSGNAVRVHPQKGSTDSLGALAIYSFPYIDPRDDVRDGNAVSLPSRFNRTEFYGDVVIAGFNSDLVVEDARSADGSFARINENEFSASTVKNFQSKTISFASISNQFRRNAFTISPLELLYGSFAGYALFFNQSDISNILDITSGNEVYFESNFFRNIPAPPLPNDTLFPWTNSGIKVKSSGGLIYERPFRPQDATGSDVVVSHSKGAKSDRGIKGLEIPAYGECLLLPKGPATLGGRVLSKNDGSEAKLRIGTTPTDLPLYEFYNGPTRLNYGGTHAISIGNVLQEHGIFGRPKHDSSATQYLYSPKNNEGDEGFEFDPGVLSQAYHHSKSNGSSIWGGKSEIIEQTRTMHGYFAVTNWVTNLDTTIVTNYEINNTTFAWQAWRFSLFYVRRGRVFYIPLNLRANSVLQQVGTITKPTYKTIDGLSSFPFLSNVSGGIVQWSALAGTNFIMSPEFSFELPNGIDTVCVEFEGSTQIAPFSSTAIGLNISTEDTLAITNLPPVSAAAPTLDSESYFTNFSLANNPKNYASPENYNDPTLSTQQDHRFIDISLRGVTNPIDTLTNDILRGISTIKIQNNFAAPTNTGYLGYIYTYQRVLQSHSALNQIVDNYGVESFSDNADAELRTFDTLSNEEANEGTLYSEGEGRANSDFQIRLLDGMVLEDVTTGTFYTIGELGRYRGWHSHMKPTSQVGDYVHYKHGVHSQDYSSLTVEMEEIYGNPLIRNANFGSIISSNGHSSPEILTDIPSHFNYENPLYGNLFSQTYPISHMKNGLGDISDGGFVRRPLVGHKFRIVPNVEFVPVLGYRSVRGGLSVPYDKSTNYTSMIPNVDAVLYDANYSFSKSDIGKKVYICGTYEYAYVGWWVITDVVSDYEVNPTEAISPVLFDVATVRKIKRSGEFLSNPSVQTDMILPMKPKSMILESTLDANSNGKNIENANEVLVNIDTHYSDPYFADTVANSETRNLLFDSDLSDVISRQGDTYEYTSNFYLSVQYLDDLNGLGWVGVKFSTSDLQPVWGAIKLKGTLGIKEGALFGSGSVSNNAFFNGVNIGRFFKDIGLSAWQDYNDTPFIVWKVKESHSDPNSKYGIPKLSDFADVCGLTCEIDAAGLTLEQRNTILGRGTFLSLDCIFNPLGDYNHSDFYTNSFPTVTDIHSVGNTNNESFISYRGFYFRKGVNTNVCISHLDKNSYYPNTYLADVDTSYESTDSNLGNGFISTKSISSVNRQSNSATGGIRWVFSSPLLEENVGSYLHLTKQRPYRFGVPTYSQKLALEAHTNFYGAQETTLVNPFGWTSGYQNIQDIENGEQLDLTTDIFRINRCPTTGDIIVGGDCESYAVEDILCRSQKGFTKKGVEISYSPLSVGGNWPDSETGNLPDTGSLNYPIMYALQPIARERVVTVNPSNANSSIVLARGQHGTAPMVIPANPLAIETNGGLSLTGAGSFTDPSGDFTLSNHEGEFYVNDPSTTGISVSLVANGLNVDEFGKDYHWGEKILMDVSRPWLLFGRDNAIQTHDLYFIDPDDADLQQGNFQDLPESVVGSYTNSGYIYKAESGNAEPFSQELIGGAGFIPTNAVYAWTPSGEWWQIQTPLFTYGKSSYNRKTPISPTTPPPTLRIDLTEAFTQSVSAGSGLNSPYAGKTPRGSRLNRIWVNFGIDGDHSPLPGSPFNRDHEEYFEDLGGTNLTDSILGNTTTKTRIKTLRDQFDNSKTLDAKPTTRAITFNLVVEIPGSVASSQDDLEIGYSNISLGASYHQDWSKFIGEDYEFSTIGGSNGTAFGGRLPTGAYSHSDNSENKSVLVNGQRLLSSRSQFFGGTVVVPLYVNREAGDMMPNIMERFVTVGPARHRGNFTTDVEKYKYTTDWSIGDWKLGLGTTPHANSYLLDKTAFYVGEHLIAGFNHRESMEINSITPVLWGSQNFFSSRLTDINTLKINAGVMESNVLDSKTSNSLSMMAFSDIRSAGVLASSMPRSSRMGGGVMSSFTSGIIPDTRLFDPFGLFVDSPLAIHSPATTGITIAHGGRPLGNGLRNNENYDLNGNAVLTNGSSSSSHNSFTVALTPVGDGFNAPHGFINMPSISSSQNDSASSLYLDLASVKHWDFGRAGRNLESNTGTSPKDRRFKVGNWLDKILESYGIPSQSGSMLPTGARVFLEVTVPWALNENNTNNGTWISSVKCSFEVETADGTAWTQDVNTMGED